MVELWKDSSRLCETIRQSHDHGFHDHWLAAYLTVGIFQELDCARLANLGSCIPRTPAQCSPVKEKEDTYFGNAAIHFVKYFPSLFHGCFMAQKNDCDCVLYRPGIVVLAGKHQLPLTSISHYDRSFHEIRWQLYHRLRLFVREVFSSMSRQTPKHDSLDTLPAISHSWRVAGHCRKSVRDIGHVGESPSVVLPDRIFPLHALHLHACMTRWIKSDIHVRPYFQSYSHIENWKETSRVQTRDRDQSTVQTYILVWNSYMIDEKKSKLYKCLFIGHRKRPVKMEALKHRTRVMRYREPFQNNR